MISTFYNKFIRQFLRTTLHISPQNKLGWIIAAGLVALSGPFGLVIAGDAPFIDAAPIAVNDSASTRDLNGVLISPLANDSGLDNTPVTVSLVSGPSRGNAYLFSNSFFLYVPATAFTGTDSFAYRVTDADGDMATATVSISVTCTTCASVSSKSLSVSWAPSAGSVLGYYVYYGSTASTASTLAVTVASPYTKFTTLAKDLNLQAGTQVCFRVKAFNAVGVSGYSSAVCGTI